MRIRQHDIEQARRAQAMIEKDRSKHYTYDVLSEKLGINVSKLQRSFKIVTGRNLYEHLTHLRMEEAMKLLETTELTIDAVAFKVGLDRSNLTKQFKKITGKCPSDWRSEQANNDSSSSGESD